MCVCEFIGDGTHAAFDLLSSVMKDTDDRERGGLLADPRFTRVANYLGLRPAILAQVVESLPELDAGDLVEIAVRWEQDGSSLRQAYYDFKAAREEGWADV